MHEDYDELDKVFNMNRHKLKQAHSELCRLVREIKASQERQFQLTNERNLAREQESELRNEFDAVKRELDKECALLVSNILKDVKGESLV